MSKDFIDFVKRYCDEYRIVSTGNLTLSQINDARKQGRLFVDNQSCLGWVALHWSESAPKDKLREIRSY